MNVHCKDFDEILRRAEPAEMAALEAHSAACPACRAQLALDRAISVTAPALRKEWQTPYLWPKLRRALAEEIATRPRPFAWSLGRFVHAFAYNWKPAVAALAMTVAALVVTWTFLRPVPAPQLEQQLLTEQALQQVEQAEAAYIRSIDALQKLAQPRLEAANTPLMFSYREKLLVLDAAIAELRAQAGRNSFNAHLRTELTSLYHQKQQTLQAVLQEN